jgi:hypothetical protein
VRKTCYSSWLANVVTMIVGLWQGSLKTLKEMTVSYCQPSPIRLIPELKVFVSPDLEFGNHSCLQERFQASLSCDFAFCVLRIFFLQKSHSKTTDLFGNGWKNLNKSA